MFSNAVMLILCHYLEFYDLNNKNNNNNNTQVMDSNKRIEIKQEKVDYNEHVQIKTEPMDLPTSEQDQQEETE